MCGIVGGVAMAGGPGADPTAVRRGLQILRHRGPEAAGLWRDEAATLGHARLSIVDLAHGQQPLSNETGTVWAVVNGEVFNHVELRRELQAAGHRFRTHSDSEVIVHLYEDLGEQLLDRLNGQYAFAVWDSRRRHLLLGRDRLGVRPLFYTVVSGALLFASEVKALLLDPRVPRRPDLQTLDQVFTFWAPLPGRTMFDGVREVPPGHVLTLGPGDVAPVIRQYWDLNFDHVDDRMTGFEAAYELRRLLDDATALRLRADVPVGAYLSGGLDSSAVSALARRHVNNLTTFSVAFDDDVFDERVHQRQVAEALGTDHHMVECRAEDIARAFPEVVWSAEVPLLRTAPAPLFVLSEIVRRQGLKVVLTGEGADELFAGYDIFKEAAVRRFWARDPESQLRPKLFGRFYPWLPDLKQAAVSAHVAAYFGQDLDRTDDPAFSHLIRWRSTSRLKRLYAPEVRSALTGYDYRSDLGNLLPGRLSDWDPLARAQYVEMKTLLGPYLLASQGDRMAMAHSVEARFPFLDHRVVDFATRIPERLRMVGFDEKRVLKQAIHDMLPANATRRTKQPYRAPVAGVFCSHAADWAEDLVSSRSVTDAGLFNPIAVARLYEKCCLAPRLSENDGMALTAVLSAQLWHRSFISEFPANVPERDDVVSLEQRSWQQAG